MYGMARHTNDAVFDENGRQPLFHRPRLRVVLPRRNKLKNLRSDYPVSTLWPTSTSHIKFKICAKQQLRTTFKTFCLRYPLSGILCRPIIQAGSLKSLSRQYYT